MKVREGNELPQVKDAVETPAHVRQSMTLEL